MNIKIIILSMLIRSICNIFQKNFGVLNLNFIHGKYKMKELFYLKIAMHVMIGISVPFVAHWRNRQFRPPLPIWK